MVDSVFNPAERPLLRQLTSKIPRPSVVHGQRASWSLSLISQWTLLFA